MPPVFIIKDFEGSITKEAARLNSGAEAVNTLFGVMTRIAADMMRIEAIVFSSQGRRGGGQWKPLKESTVKRKGSTTILVNTGELRASLTEKGAPFQILHIGNTFVEFGTDDPFADYQNRGAGNLPVRPLFKWVPGDDRRWNKWILNHLMRPHSV